MKRLSKEKRQQLILTILVTLTILSGLWYGLIRAQQRSIQKIAQAQTDAGKELAKVKETIGRAEDIEKQLEESSATLEKCEADMASGDIYAWIITQVRDFKSQYKVEIPQFSQIEGPRELTLMPSFPYKQASLTIGGTGLFHDVGRFLSDFENRYPFARLCNLVVEQAMGAPQGGGEKLSFHVEIVTLVKPQEKLN